jgi:phytanoyl-CoA hydroxylase
MLLSTEQKNSFQDHGFLVIPNLITPQRCDELISEAEALVDQFNPDEVISIFSTQEQTRTTDDYFMHSGDKVRFFFEPGAFTNDGKLRQSKNLSINKIGHALHDLNPVFKQFSRQEILGTLCQDLGLASPLLMQSMYIFKQPRIGGEVTCHQDSTFLYTDPLSVIGFWFALQDANLSNGCLHALPGGHHMGLKRKFCRNSQGGASFLELDTTPWPQEGYVPLEVEKGTLIVLHGLLPHLSGPNLSHQSRHAYTLHLVDANAHYPEENWLQRDPASPASGF